MLGNEFFTFIKTMTTQYLSLAVDLPESCLAYLLWSCSVFQLTHYWNGDSAAVILTVIFMASRNCKNWLLANSRPLSVKNFSDAP